MATLLAILREVSSLLNAFRWVWEFVSKKVHLKIESHLYETNGKKLTLWWIKYEIVSKIPDEVFVKELYIKIPKEMHVEGAIPHNPTSTQLFFGDQGKFHITGQPFTFKHLESSKYRIDAESVLRIFVQQKMNLTLVANTTQFGEIVSNSLRLNRRFLINAGLVEKEWYDYLPGKTFRILVWTISIAIIGYVGYLCYFLTTFWCV